ncbi:MAG TPA: gamma-glutamyl-gamma-aminobutyrate hydrolase family protein [Acidimicrobiales bacterium]
MALRSVAVLVGREPERRYSVHRGYVDALWAIGATPVMLAAPSSAPDVDRYVEVAVGCDAVCLTGGGDVDPSWYGGGGDEGLLSVDRARDEAEVAVVREAVAAGVAVLGVCRGIQLLNVALGGALHRDLPSAGFTGHWNEQRQHEPVHGVEASPGSIAGEALAGASTVNSIHHQAVRFPGAGLWATAWSPDGVIEAVEGPGLLGLQWHPERLWPDDDRHLAPFRWLVTA